MEYLTDLDEYAAALRKVDFSIDLNQKNASGFLMENSDLKCYTKVQKILEVQEMEKCHRRCLDIDFVNGPSDEDKEIVDKFYDVGTSRGFLPPLDDKDFPPVGSDDGEYDDEELGGVDVNDIGDGSEMYDVDQNDLYESIYNEKERFEPRPGEYDGNPDDINNDVGLEGEPSTEDFEELTGDEEDDDSKVVPPRSVASDDDDDDDMPFPDDADGDSMPFEDDAEQAVNDDSTSQPSEPAQDPTPAEQPDQDVGEPIPDAGADTTEPTDTPTDTQADDTVNADVQPAEEPEATEPADTEVDATDEQPDNSSDTTEQPEDEPSDDGDEDEDTTEEPSDDDSTEENSEESDDSSEEEKELTADEKKERKDQYTELWRKTLTDLAIYTPISDVTDPSMKSEFWDKISSGWEKEDPADFMSISEINKLESSEKVDDPNPESDDDKSSDSDDKDDADDDSKEDSDDTSTEDNKEEPEEKDSAEDNDSDEDNSDDADGEEETSDDEDSSDKKEDK